MSPVTVCIMKTADAKKDIRNLSKIVDVLKEHPGGLWVRELARRSKLHPETIRRLMNKYPAIFENYADFTAYKVNFKIIRLRNPNMTGRELTNHVKLKQ